MLILKKIERGFHIVMLTLTLWLLAGVILSNSAQESNTIYGNYGNREKVEDDPLHEVSERWAPAELRIDDLRQRMRVHVLKNRQHNSPLIRGINLVGDKQRRGDDITSRDYDYDNEDMYIPNAPSLADLPHRRSKPNHNPSSLTRFWNVRKRRVTNDDYDDVEQSAEKRADRMVHPVDRGISRSAASLALDTYRRLWMDEYMKQKDSDTKSSHDLRFIG